MMMNKNPFTPGKPYTNPFQDPGEKYQHPDSSGLLSRLVTCNQDRSLHAHHSLAALGALGEAQAGQRKIGVSMGVPRNGLLIGENPVKMDDLGVALFQETSNWELLGKKHENNHELSGE